MKNSVVGKRFLILIYLSMPEVYVESWYVLGYHRFASTTLTVDISHRKTRPGPRRLNVRPVNPGTGLDVRVFPPQRLP